MDYCKLLTIEEIHRVLNHLHSLVHWRSKHGINAKLHLTLFRLACCCGLRRGEISQLRMNDLILTGPRPCIRVRRETTKGRRAKYAEDGTLIKKDQRKPRVVPLWWDSGTLEDLQAWAEWRKKRLPDEGGGPCQATSWFLTSHDSKATKAGDQFSAQSVSRQWRTAIRCLGPERQAQVPVHGGRHTFASVGLWVGRSITEVRDALGHTSDATTSIYAHSIERTLPDMFGPTAAPSRGRGTAG